MPRYLTRCMGEAGTSKQRGRERLYCARKYERRNECVTGEKKQRETQEEKNQEPSHRQMISLSHRSEAELGEKWIVWT